MRLEADGEEKRHGDDYAAESDGPLYDEWRKQNDDQAFWRRWFFILAAGVAGLGVCAWLLPGVPQPSKSASAWR